MEQSDREVIRVAIIGGGVTGAVCARELSRPGSRKFSVTVFDQGRGLGGRTAHRRAVEDGAYTSANSTEAAFAFDHGCQFFRADTKDFQQDLLQEWLQRGWVAEWQGKFGVLGADGTAPRADFFGFPHKPPYYCAVGGMSSLPCALLEDTASSGSVDVRAGVRVASTVQLSNQKWLLSGTSGKAALHDTAEEEAARAHADSLGEFDVVIATDVSASMPAWHRASAGIPEDIGVKVRSRTRVVLFTALIAFEQPLSCEEDGFSAVDDVLWYAARTRSKPGLAQASKYDCWTLVSTPKYAAAEVERVPMQDPKTGAFRPQEMPYLQDGPCAELLSSFKRLLKQKGCGGEGFPRTVYVGGQRWGSAFPAPRLVDGQDHLTGQHPATVQVMGVSYDASTSIALAPDETEGVEAPAAKQAKLSASTPDFLADDERGIYYAGDYLSHYLPGVEGAALSALKVARHVAEFSCPRGTGASPGQA